MVITALTIFLSIVFSCFSTAVISYVALATPIGPWMEMTLVLVGTIIFRSLVHYISSMHRMHSLALATAAGGIGGAVSMACAFSFPTLYFLQPDLFNTWLQTPWHFSLIMAALVIAAGSFGFLIAYYFENKLLADGTMIFPIGQMVYNMIAVQNQLKKAWQLAWGALSALIYGITQIIFTSIPARVTLLPAFQAGLFTIPHVTTRTDMIPMFWALGFTTGHVIAIPLLVAVISRLALIDPVRQLFFNTISHTDYILAFGAGMVIQGAILGLIEMPKILHKTIRKLSSKTSSAIGLTLNSSMIWQITILLLSVIFLSYNLFSPLAQIYLLLFTIICTYQLLIIAGKLGIAPLGRFATFVMIPGILIFGFNAVQITILATFVEMAGVVAVDILFGQKVAQLASIKRTKMMAYQVLGLLASALAIGFIFWILITHFGLGTAELSATRSQSRALLVQAFNFNYIVMILGFIFGYALKLIGVNPTLVFGGLLMGLDTSLLLIGGGLSTYLVKEKEEHYPFWSGVYATNSLWIFMKIFF